MQITREQVEKTISDYDANKIFRPLSHKSKTCFLFVRGKEYPAKLIYQFAAGKECNTAEARRELKKLGYKIIEKGENGINKQSISSKKRNYNNTRDDISPEECVSIPAPEIDSYPDDCYKLDMIKGEQIPALTDKNRRFIEAVVHLDSNYKRDDDIYAIPKGKFLGSSSYWFNQMIIRKQYTYSECLQNAIIAIDRTNSTHLEATTDGREKMYKIIIQKCPDVDSLKNELKNSSIDTNHLIGLMSVDLPANGKSGLRSNLSFASKFCAYASIALGCGDLYSKYDNVVSDHLNKYVKYYLRRKITKYSIKCDSQKKRELIPEEKIKYTLDVYNNYSYLIEQIIRQLEMHNINISKSELDHIIWYGFKGVD